MEVKGKKGMESFATDEHPRETTLEKLGKLPPVFKENGVVSAGNASVSTDITGYICQYTFHTYLMCRLLFTTPCTHITHTVCAYTTCICIYILFHRHIHTMTPTVDAAVRMLGLFPLQGICDGAGAVVLASEEAVNQHNLKPLARVAGYSVSGVDPSIMGIGPAPAIRKLLANASMKLDEIDLVEVSLCHQSTFMCHALLCVYAVNLC